MALDPKDYGCTPYKGPDPTKRYDWFSKEIVEHCDRGGKCWLPWLEFDVIRWRDQGGTLADLHETITANFYDWNRSAPLNCQMNWEEVDAELTRLLAIKDTLRYSHS